jgi:glycosyltransferase involved in cell wall biosynthesis
MSTVLIIASFADSLVNFRGPLLATLVARGHAVHVAAPGAIFRIANSPLADSVTAHDLPIERTGLNPVRDIGAWRAMLALMRQLRPDVVIAYTIKPVIYGTIAARVARVPRTFALITGLGYVFQNKSVRARLLKTVVARLYRVALAGADTIFFQNADDRDLFCRLRIVSARAKTRITNGSGVDLTRFTPQPQPAGDPRVLFIGRLLKDKGVAEFAEAARIVRQDHPQVVFEMIGWYDEGNPASVDRNAMQLWLDEGVVSWNGPSDEVRPALARAAMFVLPSYHEGTPRTVLEALATARPAVTSDVPGCRETVIDGETGFLVPPRDPVALAAAITTLVQDADLRRRMGEAGLALARRKYDVEKVNADLIAAMGL